MASEQSENLKLMEEKLCRGSKAASAECEKIIGLRRAAQNGMQYVRSVRTNHMKPHLANEIRSELLNHKEKAEEALYDAPNRYTSSPDIDRLIDGLLGGFDQDENKDGVSDADRDSDGIPDVIEDGIGHLADMLDAVSKGDYSGSWDLDGDGIENDLDEHDNSNDRKDMNDDALCKNGNHVEL